MKGATAHFMTPFSQWWDPAAGGYRVLWNPGPAACEAPPPRLYGRSSRPRSRKAHGMGPQNLSTFVVVVVVLVVVVVAERTVSSDAATSSY